MERLDGFWLSLMIQSSSRAQPPQHPALTTQPCVQAAKLSLLTVERLDGFNRRTLDGLAARVYFYFAWSHECLDQLTAIQRCCALSTACSHSRAQ